MALADISLYVQANQLEAQHTKLTVVPEQPKVSPSTEVTLVNIVKLDPEASANLIAKLRMYLMECPPNELIPLRNAYSEFHTEAWKTFDKANPTHVLADT
jgi:hypothetical protein